MLQTILDLFTGNEIFDSIAAILENAFPDFPGVKQKYTQVMDHLQDRLGEASVNKEKEAIRQQITSQLLFSGLLGIQANYHYFTNPIGGNFLNTEPEIYLQEKSSVCLPEYQNAQELRAHFFAALSPAQRELFEDVTEYVCYWETVGPKLAHYYGYLLGNQLLQRVVPGYQPDIAMTLRYCAMLENYFGPQFDSSFLRRFCI